MKKKIAVKIPLIDNKKNSINFKTSIAFNSSNTNENEKIIRIGIFNKEGSDTVIRPCPTPNFN